MKKKKTNLFVLRRRRIPKPPDSSEHRIRTISQATHTKSTECLPTLHAHSFVVFELHITVFIMFFCVPGERFHSQVRVSRCLSYYCAPLYRFSVHFYRRIWLTTLAFSPALCFPLSQTDHDAILFKISQKTTCVLPSLWNASGRVSCTTEPAIILKSGTQVFTSCMDHECSNVTYLHKLKSRCWATTEEWIKCRVSDGFA